MAWDPSVLRKYSTTSHFRLLNQVRGELKNNPLPRNEDGELSLAMGRRGGAYRVPVEVRQTSAHTSTHSRSPRDLPMASTPLPDVEGPNGDGYSFRDRLRAIEMR